MIMDSTHASCGLRWSSGSRYQSNELHSRNEQVKTSFVIGHPLWLVVHCCKQADIVMESITLVENWPSAREPLVGVDGERVQGGCRRNVRIKNKIVHGHADYPKDADAD